MRCSQCHTENNDEHRFCFACGTSLTADRPASSQPAAGEGERRQLTVMFCDIVDSTALSLQYDPEELREIIRQFQDACVAVVERYEGFIAQHLGDGLLIYFGYPRAHEEDGERAVHAGLGMIEAVSALRPRPELQLQVRIGIATGKVVIGDLVSAGANTEKVAVGQTPILAARLQSLAAPNTVVISPHTYRLLGQRFECRETGVHTLKGIPAPVRVREVVGQGARQTRFAATQGMTVLPLVGRREEMVLLDACTQRALEGYGQVVLLRGEAGIGKSRLVRAQVENISTRHSVVPIELQCSPYYNQSALFPIIEWLQEIFYAHGAINDAEKWTLLNRFLDQTTLDKGQAGPLLALLLSVPLPAGHAPLNLTPDRQKQLTLQHLVSLLKQLNPSPLVLLVVEDLHWADPTTLELISMWMADAIGSKTMTLLTSRPEFAPPWLAQDNFKTLNVGRLPDAHALELALLAAGDAILDESVLQQLVKKTDNVPLYLEVMTKHLVHNSLLNAGGGVSQDDAGLTDDEIPATLHDALMARLDRMGETKTVAQVAAILGRDFDRKMLEAVWMGSPKALQLGLDELQKADLLQAREDRAKGVFQFKHALIRDVAYDSLLKRNCETLHRHIADVLEHEFPGIAARQPDVLAHHYTAGKELDKALRYWLAAGQLALKNFATQESVAHLNRGLALLVELPATPERDIRELDFRILLGHALMTWKGYAAEEVRVSCARAHELCAIVGNAPQLPIALYQLIAYNIVSANLVTALKLARQLYEIAVQVGNDDLFVEGCVTVGVTYFHLGEFNEAQRYLEKCLESYDAERHANHAFQFGQDPAVVACNFLIWIYWIRGEQAQALQAAEQALSLARRLNHPLTLAFALTFAGWHRMFCRDYEEAVAIGQEIVQLCSEQNILIFLAHGHMMAAWYDCDKGNMENGLCGMLAALDIFRLTGAQHFLPYWEAHHAMMRVAAGDIADAETILSQSFDRVTRTDERWSEAELYRYRGMLLEKTGRPPAEIEACYRQAIAIAQRQGAVTWELRAIRNLARCLIARQEKQQARQLIESQGDKLFLDIDRDCTAQLESLLADCSGCSQTT